MSYSQEHGDSKIVHYCRVLARQDEDLMKLNYSILLSINLISNLL